MIRRESSAQSSGLPYAGDAGVAAKKSRSLGVARDDKVGVFLLKI